MLVCTHMDKRYRLALYTHTQVRNCVAPDSDDDAFVASQSVCSPSCFLLCVFTRHSLLSYHAADLCSYFGGH